MCDVFKFFKKEENDRLLEIESYDLDLLLQSLSNYYIEYRDSLNLDSDITFGVELEVANSNIYKIKNQVDLNPKLNYNWDTQFDTSIFRGAEVDSPIMKDNILYWDDLNSVCNILKNIAVITNETSSHVHVGSYILGENKENWLNFIKIWAAYENIIYRFTNGEYINTRVSAYEYAEPINNILEKIYLKYKKSKTLYNMLCDLSKDRQQAVNFMNINKRQINKKSYKNTIEFRTPNGTLNSIIIQNNINFFTKLLLYCKNKKYNDDIITKRLRNEETRKLEFEMYNDIYLTQALELVDLIFDNNLDKINFLKQYLKNFEMTCRLDIKCKKLTK